jgi:hypothetical protein
LDQVDLSVEFVNGDPIAQVAVQTIGFLHEHDQPPLVLAGARDRAAKGGPTSLLGGFDINELFGNLELAAGGIRPQQIELEKPSRS